MQTEVVVLCALLGVASAALGLAKLQPKPEEYSGEEGCFIAELDQVIPFGQARPSLKSCMEYRCSAEWVQLASCGIAVVTPPQELVTDPEKPYPGCCPTLKEDSPPTNANFNK